jgi:hypothetical protein
MKKLSAPKINNKAIRRLNKALDLTGINGDRNLSVSDDNTYTLRIHADHIVIPIRVNLCGDYLINGSITDIANDILERFKVGEGLLIYDGFEEVSYPPVEDKA